MILSFWILVAVAAAVDEPACSCAELQLQVNELGKEVNEQKAQLQEQKAQLQELRELVLRGGGRGEPAPSGDVGERGAPARSRTSVRQLSQAGNQPARTIVKVGVDGTGTRRALSETSSSMTVHAWQTHVFPACADAPKLEPQASRICPLADA